MEFKRNGGLIGIEMRFKRMSGPVALSCLDRFLPGGSVYGKWAEDHIEFPLPDEKHVALLYTVRGSARIMFGRKISRKKLDDLGARLDGFSFNVLPEPFGFDEGTQWLARYGARYTCVMSGGLAVLGAFAQYDDQRSFFELKELLEGFAVEMAGALAPDQLWIGCGEKRSELRPTHSFSPGPRRAWVSGYPWILMVPPAVAKDLGGIDRVLREAPVRRAWPIAFGDSKTAVMCELGPDPLSIPQADWRAWKDYLKPVLGLRGGSAFSPNPWILPEDLAEADTPT
jgi:hypothetical protein